MITRYWQSWMRWIERKLIKISDRWETEEAMASNPAKIQQRGLKDECLTKSNLRTWLEICGKKQEEIYVEIHTPQKK